MIQHNIMQLIILKAYMPFLEQLVMFSFPFICGKWSLRPTLLHILAQLSHPL